MPRYSLFDLKSEIRQKIFRYALHSDKVINAESLLIHRHWPDYYVRLSLFHVCRTIRQEAIPQFFLYNKFSLIRRTQEEFDDITSQPWCALVGHLKLILSPDSASDPQMIPGLRAFSGLEVLEIETDTSNWPQTREFGLRILKVLGCMRVSKKVSFTGVNADISPEIQTVLYLVMFGKISLSLEEDQKA